MQPSKQILNFIASFEAFRAKPYKDAAGIWTIGYGSTLLPTGQPVKATTAPVTKELALKYMETHISFRVVPYIPTGLPQNEFDALVSFVYNVGAGAFETSTLKKKVLAQAPCQEIRAAFMMFVKSKGKTLNGLVHRRTKEADIFCNADYLI